jgi:hypothetical protein
MNLKANEVFEQWNHSPAWCKFFELTQERIRSGKYKNSWQAEVSASKEYPLLRLAARCQTPGEAFVPWVEHLTREAGVNLPEAYKLAAKEMPDAARLISVKHFTA